MNAVDIIIAVVLVLAVGIALFHIVRHKSCCSGGCASCSHCESCRHSGKYPGKD